MARSGGFTGYTDRIDQMRSFPETPIIYNPIAQMDKAGQEELNLLKGGYKKSENAAEEQEDQWFAEDGFPTEEADQLEYVKSEDVPPPSVMYEVQYKMIAIRKTPSAEGRVLGTAVKGDVLATFGLDESGDWRKVHYRLRGGWGSKVVAWVMETHPKLGRLIKPQDEVNAQAAAAAGQAPAAGADGQQPQQQDGQAAQGAQPAQEQVAPAKATPVPISAAELEDAAREVEELEELHKSKGKKEKKEVSELELLKGGKKEESEDEEEPQPLPTTSPEGYTYATAEELDEGADSGGLQYQVVHKPFVAMRHLPGAKGKVVTSLEYGSYVDTFGWCPKKKFRKMYCRAPDGRIIVGWVMTSHPELGPLVEPAAG